MQDAVGWLRDLPAESVDLLITDPAYESLEKHRAVGTTTRLKHSKSSSNDWFTIFPNARFPELFCEMFRVLSFDEIGTSTLQSRAFAGLANTEQFFESLRDAGVDVCATLTFPDHHRYSRADVDRIASKLQTSGADAVSATMMHSAVINEYVLDAATRSNTDWVLTFPTKRFYVDRDKSEFPFTARDPGIARPAKYWGG